MNRLGTLASAVTRLEQTCAQQRVIISLPSALQKQLQQQAASSKSAAAQQEMKPMAAAADPAAVAAAMFERDRFVWSVPEIKQVLWLVAGAYDHGNSALQQSADGIIATFKKHCKVWEWSAADVPAQVSALVSNLHTATFSILKTLSNSRVLRYKQDCRPKGRSLQPMLQLQHYLVKNIYGYNHKVLQMVPRKWNTLGATRMDWAAEPKDLEIVALVKAAMAVIWKGEHLPAMQPALELAQAVTVEVQRQLVPEADPWDRMAVEYCNRLNGLKLLPLRSKDFPLQRLMAAAVTRAEALRNSGINWDGVGCNSFWSRVGYALIPGPAQSLLY